MQKYFKDVLVFKHNFKFVFNGKEFSVFKERLESCCSHFYTKLKSKMNNNCNSMLLNNDNMGKKIDMFEYNDKDIKEKTFSTFVDCINGEEISINEENSAELIILGIEFGYERLVKECHEYIDNKEIEKKKEINCILRKLISQINSCDNNNKDSGDIVNNNQDELEKIISRHFNIAIDENDDNEEEEENESKLIWEIPIEMLSRILNNESFNKSQLNEKQKHRFIELVIYHLKKEGKEASILMDGFPMTFFSSSDIELLIKENAFMISAFNIRKEDITQMIEKDKKYELQEKLIEEMREEIKLMRKNMIKIIEELLENKSIEIEKRKEEEKKQMIKEMKEIRDEMKIIVEVKEETKKMKESIKDLVFDPECSMKLPYSVDEKGNRSKGMFEFFTEYFKGNPIYKGFFILSGKNSSNVIISKGNMSCGWMTKKPNSFFEIDFSGLFYVLIDKYFINVRNNNHQPFSWEIEGRTREGAWCILDVMDECTIFDGSLRESVFKIKKQKPIFVSAVRMRLLRNKSNCSFQNSNFEISFIELYGTIVKK